MNLLNKDFYFSVFPRVFEVAFLAVREGAGWSAKEVGFGWWQLRALCALSSPPPTAGDSQNPGLCIFDKGDFAAIRLASVGQKR